MKIRLKPGKEKSFGVNNVLESLLLVAGSERPIWH
jgi:hypothetical protein